MEVVEDCGASEVENRRRRVEERCEELELEIVKRKSEYEDLEIKFRALEGEKLAMEEEIRALKRGSDEIRKQANGGGDGTEIIVDFNEDSLEGDGVFQLMLENKVLECEKKTAESEVEAWKQKFKELKTWVLKLDKDLVLKGGEFPWNLTGDSVEASRRTQPNERIELEDGLNVGVGMESSRSKDIAVNVIDLSSTYHSPGKEICHLQEAGTPPNVTLHEHRSGTKEEERSGMEYGNVSRARKQLEFKEDRSPCKKMAPPTPGGGRPFSLSVIDISDSDDEVTIADNQKVLPTENQGSRKICISSDSVIGGLATKSFLKQAHTDGHDQEDLDNYNEELLAFSTPKRKRASNVVTSDSESSDDNIPINAVKRMDLQKRIHDHSESSDDNVPINSVKRMHRQKRIHNQVGSDVNASLETATTSVVDDVSVTSPKRHLVRLRKGGGRGRAQRNSSQTSETKNDRGPNKGVEEDEPEEVGSESEGESLGGFIVHSSDVSESNDASSESNSVSDDDVNLEEVLSTFQRNKDHNTRWEYEADMLSAFAKDPELCMKAVCALYRQQTSEEKMYREALCSNSRGFSKFDASRGSKLASFLTDGDPYCDLRKTVEELEEHDPKALETCRTFATRYSKQLFEIYKNKEDPLFLPS
ncbi:hypothetical protein RchiOBHm_Chr1g0380081 [Rosa chinensis]|uniref:Uncharacterized protein n=1 Tax=Rosa chinensis TaxID=74649 RepID=A0A2P6SNR7_ROSCH|nr:uncharacterized protein LOC112182608 [Rosa chinensis]XP_024176899.1 uncharacterized protein LOC112182608 [Rosa chinensis]PRQ60338.1 hypothetical protein RchiOBHm_Chr1g0380081 [Rosa chinensis]